jgi:hypothetical protein
VSTDGLFTRLETVDGAVTRFYARRKVWLWSAVALPVVFVLGWMVWVMLWAPPIGGVTLIIHTRIDRPILGFSVNGVAGGNSWRLIPAINTPGKWKINLLWFDQRKDRRGYLDAQCNRSAV